MDPRWVKSQTMGPISSAPPGGQVRVQDQDRCTRMDVFVVPEHALARAIAWLRQRPGRWVTQLYRDDTVQPRHGLGSLSEAWAADDCWTSHKSAYYVGRTEDGRRTPPLRVNGRVTWSWTRPSVDVRLAAGPPPSVPITAEVEVEAGSGQHTLQGVTKAPVGPAIDLRVMTASSSDWPLDRYLDAYLPAAAETFELDAGELRDAFHALYGAYLDDAGVLGAEISPGGAELDAGQFVTCNVSLVPQAPGRTLLAVGLFERETQQLVEVSDLVGLVVDEDGGVTVDF